MAHVFEVAPTGRSKCRGCSQAIEKGALRFGERLPNPFADGEMTLWFHPKCAAYKRPEPFLEGLGESSEDIADREALEGTARTSLQYRRLPRVDGAELSPSGQAKCRHCRQPIERGSWRIRVVFFEEGLFTAGGVVHLQCCFEYLETRDILDRILHFSSGLDAAQIDALSRAFESCGTPR